MSRDYPSATASSKQSSITKWYVTFPGAALVLSALLLGVTATSAQPADETFTPVADIQIPCIPNQVPCLSANNQFGFDISFVDPQTDLLFVTDASNLALDVIQASTRTFLFFITQGTVRGKGVKFTGAPIVNGMLDLPHLGPDGVITVSPTEAWVGDGDSAVKVVDLLSRQITNAIPTGGTTRADELAYDPLDHIVIVGNPDEGSRGPGFNPFLSLISTKTHKVLQRFFFPGATGLEQPSWSPQTGLFYVSVPSLHGDPLGNDSGVAVIDPRSKQLVTIFPTGDCDPTGSAIGPDNQMLLGCNNSANPNATAKTVVMDIGSGEIVQTFTEAGFADEVWFNPRDNHYFVTHNAFGPSSLGVFDAERLRFDGPLVPTGFFSHSLAANPATNEVFVPIGSDPMPGSDCPNGCIRVYMATGSDRDDGRDEDGEKENRRDSSR